MYGATIDDYFKSLEQLFLLQQGGELYYNSLIETYNAMPEDAENRPASADEYYAAEMNKLVEGSEVINITGK